MPAHPPGPRLARRLPALLIALAGCGGGGGGGGGGNEPDTEPPSVAISAPAPGVSVSGDVTISATASDGESVAGVRFEADGTAIGVEDTDPPYQTVWAAGAAAAGSHTLVALARDPSGNVGTSEPVVVTVAAATVPADRIAFTAIATPGSPAEIRTIAADGTGETRVVTDVEGDFATWSPDGTQLAFIRRIPNASTLYRVNADGTGLTDVATLPAFAEELDWGSGGTLVFAAVRAGTIDLYSIESDGSDLRPVFAAAANRLSPAWSPDGTRLAYSAVQADGDVAHLTLVNPDGSSPQPLTTGSRDLSASWSPDGTTLAFRRDGLGGGTTQIWIVGEDGTGLRKLADTGGPQFSPSWSPDGAWVAFTSESVSGQPLMIARADGAVVREVHGAFRFSGQPEWGAGPD